MFNGTNLALNSDLALVSIQVKTLLYIVWQKARHPTQVCPLVMEWGIYQGTGKSTRRYPYFYSQEDEVRVQIQRGGGAGVPDLPSKITKI